MSKYIKIAAAVVLAFIVFQLYKLYNFAYEFSGISFSKLSTKQMSGKIYLKIINTSIFGLQINSFSFDILKDTQEKIASITSQTQTKVEPNGNSISTLEFNYNIQPSGVVKDGLYFLNPYFMLIFKGFANVKIFGYNFEIPVKFDYQHTPTNTATQQ